MVYYDKVVYYLENLIMQFLFESLARLRTCLSFVLHLLALIALYAMHLRGFDTSSAIVGVLVSYSGGQTIKQVGAFVSASKDPNADTAKVIANVNER
jgi:asparagine N-glycosylation enzyme membrane subunit Stt3